MAPITRSKKNIIKKNIIKKNINTNKKITYTTTRRNKKNKALIIKLSGWVREAVKIEIGYQEMRKKIFLDNLKDNDYYALDELFSYKNDISNKKMNNINFRKWYINIKEKLTKYDKIVGTLLITFEDDEAGHYISILFNNNDDNVLLFDPANGSEQEIPEYDCRQLKAFLKENLEKEKKTVSEIIPKYSCQINNEDTLCQTWSLIMIIEYIKKGNIEELEFVDKLDNMILNCNTFIKKFKEYILPSLEKEKLNDTFIELTDTNHINTHGMKAYDLLITYLLDKYSYLFFRDTPYPFAKPMNNITTL